MLFETPKQVLFWDIDGEHYVGGIGYENTIICSCCGGIIDIQELYEFTPDDIVPIMIFEDWVDINDGGAFEQADRELIDCYYAQEEIVHLAEKWTYFRRFVEVTI